MTRAIDLRREINRSLGEGGTKVSVNDLIIRACAVSLVEHPRPLVDRRPHRPARARARRIAVARDNGLTTSPSCATPTG